MRIPAHLRRIRRGLAAYLIALDDLPLFLRWAQPFSASVRHVSDDGRSAARSKASAIILDAAKRLRQNAFCAAGWRLTMKKRV